MATPRSPERPTFGPAVAAVAEALGQPLQPWQRQVVDVALELVPDPAGRLLVDGVRHRWAYRTVVVHVPRQAGKTTLLAPTMLHRCLIRPLAETWFTAQSRQDARDTMLKMSARVGQSPLARLTDPRKSNGSEGLTVTATGSTFRVFAPAEDALHGKATEAVAVDEVWAFDGAEGQALEQAIRPTFSTTGGQLWMVSNAGTAASTWMLSYVDRGRAAVAAGRREGIAYFEWGLAPDEGDAVAELLTEARRIVDDEAARLGLLDQAAELVLARHPGQYVLPSVVRDEAESMPPGEFLRAYACVWTRTAETAIPAHVWEAAGDDQVPAPAPGQPSLTFDVSLDRHGSIGASWHLPGGQLAVDCVDARAGTEWMVERLEQLAERWRVTEVACDGAGPALDVADALERRGKVKVRRLTTTEYLTACAGWLADLTAGTLRHRRTPALEAAVPGAAMRNVGDRWAWSRRTSADNVAPIVATTVARYVLLHKPAPMAAPLVVWSTSSEGDPPAHAGERGPAGHGGGRSASRMLQL